jgi:hypothetical protein
MNSLGTVVDVQQIGPARDRLVAIHTRPHGMKKLKLDVGSKVVAHREVRMTVLGTPLIEAHEVHRVTLE